MIMQKRPRGLEQAATGGHNAGMKNDNDPREAFGRLYDIFVRLRAPDGCPWDREQTPKSIRGNLIEEAYECVEAINEGELEHIKEEIGDVMLVATMMAVIYEESGAFNISDALNTTSDKLVRRHPHVFGDSEADTPDAVLKQWNDIKENVEGRRKKDSALDAVSKALPPLERAYKLQKAAAKVGFDWPTQRGVLGKIREELLELEAAVDVPDPTAIDEELGDLLFSVVNLARHRGSDPELLLAAANTKFEQRFAKMEQLLRERALTLDGATLEQMESAWQAAKSDPKH